MRDPPCSNQIDVDDTSEVVVFNNADRHVLFTIGLRDILGDDSSVGDHLFVSNSSAKRLIIEEIAKNRRDEDSRNPISRTA